MKAQDGFTLIELLIVVVVVGILAAIALPSYKEYLIRGKIPDATSNLATKRVQMEQFFMDNRTYVGAPACTADTTSSKNFDFSCTVQTATTYTLQAAGKTSMSGFTYTIDQANAKTSAFASPAPSGWAAASPNNCWVTNVGGVC
jgi:type IV pilus assembly protein PilE